MTLHRQAILKIIFGVACLFFLIYLLLPWPALEAHTETGELLFCEHDREALYESRNSIYGDTVTEAWAFDSGEILITRVTSTPIVLDYYGITEYQLATTGLASGTPTHPRYPNIRMKITPRGEQKIKFATRTYDLSATLPEGQVVIFTPRQLPRWASC